MQGLLERFSLAVPDFLDFSAPAEDDDSDLPPLEEVAGTSILERAGKSDWHVFHPTFGVIPQELIDRWAEEESQREELRQILLENRRPPPPIRFSEGFDGESDRENESERESIASKTSEKELIQQSVALERTLSGFEAVGIE